MDRLIDGSVALIALAETIAEEGNPQVMDLPITTRDGKEITIGKLIENLKELLYEK